MTKKIAIKETKAASVDEPKRSLFQIKPYAEESGRAFLFRAVEILHMPGLSSLNSVLGIHTYNLAAPEALERYAHFFRTSFDEISPHFYPRVEDPETGTRYKFLSHYVNKHQLTIKFSKQCPQCLRESQPSPASWDLVHVVCCTKHACYLIDRCPECQKQLGLARSRAHLCNCGYDLRLITCEPVPDTVIRITKLIESKAFYGVPRNKITPTAYHPGFTNLSLCDLLKMVTLLGASAQLFRDGARVSCKLIMQRTQVQKRLLDADILMRNWPQNFQAILNAYAEQVIDASGKISGSVQKAFGPFGVWYFKHRNFARYRFICEVFENYFIPKLNAKTYKQLSNILRTLSTESEWMSATQAEAAMPGTARHTIVRQVMNGALDGIHIAAHGTRKSETWIKRESFERWRKSCGLKVPMNEAARRLGVTENFLCRLVEAHILDCNLGRRRGPKVQRDFLVSDLQKIIDAFEESLLITPAPKKKEWIMPLRAVQKRVGFDGIIGMIRQVLNKTLRIAARVDNEQGLYSYAFFTSDVARFRTIGIERKDEMLNSGEAALMLGLDKRVAAALLRNKQFFNRKKHGCQKFVSRSEMKAFKEKYIFAREIASKFNTRSIRVVNHMARLGVKSFCLKSGKSLTYFYIRDEVEMLAVPPTTHMLQKYL